MNAVAHISQLSKLADGDPRTYHGSHLLQSLLIASPTSKVETTLGIARRLRWTFAVILCVSPEFASRALRPVFDPMWQEKEWKLEQVYQGVT